MRRIAMCAMTALIAACSYSTSALADGRTTVDIDSHVTPVIRVFTPKTTPSTLAVRLTLAGPDGTSAATLKQAILKFTLRRQGQRQPVPVVQRAADPQPRGLPEGLEDRIRHRARHDRRPAERDGRADQHHALQRPEG